jgi:pyruvoyl-dependent arginine decarboxylase (PvlArgDC)
MTESMEESRTIATAYHSPVSSDKAESGGSSESEADESAITSTGETTSDPASEQLNSGMQHILFSSLVDMLAFILHISIPLLYYRC